MNNKAKRILNDLLIDSIDDDIVTDLNELLVELNLTNFSDYVKDITNEFLSDDFANIDFRFVDNYLSIDSLDLVFDDYVESIDIINEGGRLLLCLNQFNDKETFVFYDNIITISIS